MMVVKSIWSDLGHAGRSLAKARAFTFVCVVSLGIGMIPVIAIPYAGRIVNMPPPGVNPERLVELDTTRVGQRAASWSWSYPDFLDLREANTGMALIGWVHGNSKTRIQTSGRMRTQAVATMFVSANYFSTIGVALARGPGFGASTEPAVILG